MTSITYAESVRLTQEILSQPPGDWTHMLDGKPVREVARHIVGKHEIVFFRADDYCGRWIVEQFDKRAKPYVPEEVREILRDHGIWIGSWNQNWRSELRKALANGLDPRLERKLHHLLKQADELKEMLEERDAEQCTTA